MNPLNIEIKREPFIHVLIHDIYDDNERSSLWAELLFLQKRMVPGYSTGSAGNTLGIPKKRNTGLFVNEIYRNVEFSSVLVLARTLLSDSYLKHTISNINDVYFDLYDSINSDICLVQAYANGDYYKPHRDDCIFTSICCFTKEPRTYSGGLLHFPKHEYLLDLQDNQCIIFPSRIEHGVTEVKTLDSSPEKCRFTVSNFMKIS